MVSLRLPPDLCGLVSEMGAFLRLFALQTDELVINDQKWWGIYTLLQHQKG
jgi:hypothetical protein